MGSRHSARTTAIQIIRVKVLDPEDTKRPHIKQFHVRFDDIVLSVITTFIIIIMGKVIFH